GGQSRGQKEEGQYRDANAQAQSAETEVHVVVCPARDDVPTLAQRRAVRQRKCAHTGSVLTAPGKTAGRFPCPGETRAACSRALPGWPPDTGRNPPAACRQPPRRSARRPPAPSPRN